MTFWNITSRGEFITHVLDPIVEVEQNQVKFTGRNFQLSSPVSGKCASRQPHQSGEPIHSVGLHATSPVSGTEGVTRPRRVKLVRAFCAKECSLV